MIEYYKSAYGLTLLLRVTGSATYRSFAPALVSAVLVVWIRLHKTHAASGTNNEATEQLPSLQNPTVVSIFMSSLSFLLVFRLQAAYARYWEAITAVHGCLSKWLDTTMHAAAYHLQSDVYDAIKPPSFNTFANKLDRSKHVLTRARERNHGPENLSESQRLYHRAIEKSIAPVVESKLSKKKHLSVRKSRLLKKWGTHLSSKPIDDPVPLKGTPRLGGGWEKRYQENGRTAFEATFFDPQNPDLIDPCGFAGVQGGRTPPLFLQELAHLASLLSAVALSTLRNDIEGAESPLDIYEPGSPWPAVDPHKHESLSQRVNFFLGNTKTARERTRYNASRPLQVLGGVSEAEIKFLQMARGPSAKTQLCWFWLSEFITREHISGSMGRVPPPIISRLPQFLSDGMTSYNQARKIMFIPFPFPHAQLAVFFMLVSIPCIAMLAEQHATPLWLASALAFLITSCLTGMHEVARELENPFREIPNELPLVTMQAQFNEALITMYSGFHPDFFWEDRAKALLESPSIPEHRSDIIDENLYQNLAEGVSGDKTTKNEMSNIVSSRSITSLRSVMIRIPSEGERSYESDWNMA